MYEKIMAHLFNEILTIKIIMKIMLLHEKILIT